jgi:hypothetical protein
MSVLLYAQLKGKGTINDDNLLVIRFHYHIKFANPHHSSRPILRHNKLTE